MTSHTMPNQTRPSQTMPNHATTSDAHPTAGPSRTPAVRPVSFTRLVRVEARKLVDTRAGRALLGLCALITAVSVWGAIVWMPDLQFENVVMFLFDIATIPVSMLVPVVAILAATAEWSQRTGLATFALEPRRARVIAAKVAVSCGAGLLAAAAALAAVLLGLGITTLLGDAPGSWGLGSHGGARLAGTTLVIVLTMLQASAFGFALLNTPAAIVSFFVLPTAVTMASTLSTWFAEHAAWLDIASAGSPFLSGQVTSTDWMHLASAAAIWIGLPMAVGVVRVLRSDLK